jgi:hypothetical protein
LRIQGNDFKSLDIRFEKPIYVPAEKWMAPPKWTGEPMIKALNV